MNRHAKLIEILKRLKKAYGAPRPFKATEPVDEIIRTILSQNTNDRNSLAAFAKLKKHFRRWDEVVDTDARRIAAVIKHAGLANIKAKRIKEVLLEIKRRERKISLSALKGLDVGSGLEYLMSLKGIGPKTAACVLLFSFRKPVMPVDTHIFRVSKRLGLIAHKVNIEEAHKILTDMCLSDRSSKGLIYELHLCIIEHGRRTCKAQNPRCGFCVLYNMCSFEDKRQYKEDSH